MGLPSAGSRASELPEISESHNFAAPLAATGCHKLAEQVLGAGLKFLWLIIDQIYRSGPEEETREHLEVLAGARGARKWLSRPLPTDFARRRACFRMVAMLVRVEYFGDPAAFGTFEAKRADKLAAGVIRDVAAQWIAEE
jgi:hypothetical protein